VLPTLWRRLLLMRPSDASLTFPLRSEQLIAFCWKMCTEHNYTDLTDEMLIVIEEHGQQSDVSIAGTVPSHRPPVQRPIKGVRGRLLTS